MFTVTDHGPGIPPEVQDRVFDWFEIHSLGSRHRGAGLGLSIVRSFVELHGGTVTLDSAVGHGTTVACIFPLEQHAEPDGGVAVSKSASAAIEATGLTPIPDATGRFRITAAQRDTDGRRMLPLTSGGSSFTVALANEQATRAARRSTSRPRSSPAIW